MALHLSAALKRVKPTALLNQWNTAMTQTPTAAASIATFYVIYYNITGREGRLQLMCARALILPLSIPLFGTALINVSWLSY